MKKKEAKPNFNNKVIKEMTKSEFVDSHKLAYPDLDLAKEYDKITGKAKPEQATT